MRYGPDWQMKIICALGAALGLLHFAVNAWAQTQPERPPDPEFLQAAVKALQNQRNNVCIVALDNQVSAEAREAVLIDKLNKANALITELQRANEIKPPKKEDGQ